MKNNNHMMWSTKYVLNIVIIMSALLNVLEHYFWTITMYNIWLYDHCPFKKMCN